MMFSSKHSLPSEWDRRFWGRHQLVQEYLKVEGLAVKYVGPGESDQQAASIFADHAVPADVPLYYWEVTVLNQGECGFIGIGFCVDTVNLERLPGWEPRSYGYHGDDGHAFHGSGQGRPFGPGFGTGDVVGALLDRGRNTISYYKNGEPVGVAFYDVKEQQLYPCVGLRTRHEEVRANFGAEPFVTDTSRLQAEFKERVLADILAVPLPATVEVPAPPPPAAEAAQRVRQQQQQQHGEAEMVAALASFPGDLGAAAQRPAPAPAPAAAAGASGDTTRTAAAAATAAGCGDGSGGGSSQPLMPLLIFNYLLHTRCWKTAAVVARDMLQQPQAAAGAAAGGRGSDGAAAAAAGAGDGAAPVPMDSSGAGAAAGGAAGAAAGAAAGDEDHPMPDAGGVSSMPGDAPAAAAAAAAAAATARAGRLSQADIHDALLRQQVYDTICGGRVADALAVVHAHYGPHVLDATPGLAFKLRVQQFVELVRQAGSSSSSSAGGGGAAAVAGGSDAQHTTSNGGAAHVRNGGAACAAAAGGGGSGGGGDSAAGASQAAAAGAAAAACSSAAPGAHTATTSSSSSSSSSSGFEAALAYGRAELGPGLKGAADEELLSDALSLLAYADPAASPCGHLLRESTRAQLAEELNGALLKARGSSGQPLLEAVYRQAAVLVDELKRQGLPAALVLDVPGLCSSPPQQQQQQQQASRQRQRQQQAGAAAAAPAPGSSTMQLA